MTRILGISAVLFLLAGCTPTEGQRCNPEQFTSDCNSGFACVYPTNCAVAYCCPTTRASTNPNCQACPAADAGVDAATAVDAASHD